MATLEVKDLHVEIEEEKDQTREILKGVNLTMNTGEIHASWDLTERVNQHCHRPSWVIAPITLRRVTFY